MQEVYGEWLPQSQNTANLCFSSVVVPSQMDSSIEPQARTCVVVSSEKESSSSLGIVTNVGPTEGIDLNKTPAQKPKRKKHRPKVIKEGQPVKTPKSTTRQPPKEKGEQPSGKRKYVRRKGLNTPASQPPQEGADSHSGTEPKPVRRCLDFNEEGPQENTHLGSRVQATEVSTVTRDSQLSIATGQRNAQVQVACHLGASTSSIYSSTDLMANAQLLQADSMPKGVMFDLNSSINQMPSDRTNFMDNHGQFFLPGMREALDTNRFLQFCAGITDKSIPDLNRSINQVQNRPTNSAEYLLSPHQASTRETPRADQMCHGHRMSENPITTPQCIERTAMRGSLNPKGCTREAMIINQMLHGYKMPESPMTPAKHIATEEMGQNLNEFAIKNHYLKFATNMNIHTGSGLGLHDSCDSTRILATDTREHNAVNGGHILSDMNFDHPNNGRAFVNGCHATTPQTSYFPETYKKMRTENHKNLLDGIAGNFSSTPSYLSSNWNANTASAINSEVFTFADAQRLIALEKSRASRAMLGLGLSENNRVKRSNLVPHHNGTTLHGTSNKDCIAAPDKQFRYTTTECSLLPSTPINLPRENYIPRSGSQLQYLEHNMVKGSDLLVQMHNTSPQDDTMNSCCMATPGKQIRHMISECSLLPSSLIDLPRENYIPRSGSQLQSLEHNTAKESDLLAEMHSTSRQDDTVSSCCITTSGKQIRHMTAECSLSPSNLINVPRENYIPRSESQLQSLEHNTIKGTDLLAEMHSTSPQDDTVNNCCFATPGKQIRSITAEAVRPPITMIRPSTGDDILRTENCQLEVSRGTTVVKPSEKPKARGRPRKEAKPGEEPKRRGRPRKEKVGNVKLTSKVSHTALLKHEGVSCVSGPYTGMTSTAKAVDSESNRDRDGISCILTTSEYDYCGSRCSKQSNGESISGAIAPSADPLDLIIQKIKFLDINKSDEVAAAEPQNALVPYKGEFGAIVPYEGKVKRKRSRAKVNLDPVTTLMWKLLMGPDLSDGADGMDKDKEKWLDEERRIFRGRVDSFIARMHLVQGDRRFSPWKGSVVDSVVGVFLTQNVSDHLSSSAYMALAARFPVKSKGHEKPAEGVFHTSPEGGGSGPFGEVIRLQGKFFIEEISNVGSIITTEEKEGSNSNELFGTSSGDAVDCTAGVHSNSYGKLPIRLHEIGQPGTVVTATGTASVIEAEDGSLEDVVSSQNSAVSSQSSPDYLFQTTDHMGSISLPNFTAEDFAIRNMSNNIGSSTTYTELLQMQELQSKSNEKIGSSEYHGVPVSGADKVALVNEVNNLSSRHEPVHSSVSYLQNGQVDFPGVPYVNHLDKSLYTGLDRVNDSNVTQAEAGFYQLPSSSDMANKNKTKMINSLSSLLYGIDESLSQEKSLFPPASSQEADLISPIFEQYFQPLISSESVSCTKEHSFCENNLSRSVTEAPHVKQHENSNLREECTTRVKQMGGENFQSGCSQQDDDVGVQPTKDGNHSSSSLCPNQKANLETLQGVPSDLIQKSKDAQKSSPEVPGDGAKAKKPRLGTAKKRTYDWDSLRKEVFCNCGYKERCHTAKDSIDWEAVRQVDVREISDTIRERGMNNMLAERIKEFLNRVVRDHGSIDLEWLRDVQPDKAKDYLLSIRGLGLKSVECVRLLTLHHMAFPVDTNVGRICVRLGWVPLQPLPESLQLHLLELYPMLENIQKYLWPRLCKLDQRTLYELHYQMITFGKVFCTKSKPNCNACPMRAECKHFASAFASARLALPGPEEKSLVTSGIPIAADSSHQTYINSRPLGQLEWNANSCKHVVVENRQPIIEEPASPEPEPESSDVKEGAIEDVFVEDPDEIPTIKLNFEEFTQNLKSYMQANNIEIEDADMSKALVAITPEAASIPTPKLKNVSRLRTEHQVYELPDAHPLLEGFDQRQPDDPCPYLLSIWTPGETAQSTDAPKTFCNSQETGKLCESMTCFSCNSTREAQAQKVRGTLLIPCRTAMRGSFPLNGTYFQVNEVFADHYTSQNPIDVPRSWIWNLPRRTVYFGTSIPTIFKGLTTEDIQHCFWRGFVCVRGFDRTSRAPRPLYARLHFPASKITRNKKSAASAAARNEE